MPVQQRWGAMAGMSCGGAALCLIFLRGLSQHPHVVVFVAFALAGGLCTAVGVSNLIKPTARVVRTTTARGFAAGHRQATRADGVLVLALGLALCLGAAAGDVLAALFGAPG